MKLQIIDTETTDLNGEVIEFAMITTDENLNILDITNNLIKPETKVAPSASCVHGITNEMLADKHAFSEVIGEYDINPKVDVFIAHNAPFDKSVLIKAGMVGLEDTITIDTLKLAKALLPKRWGNDKLGTLFYGYECYKTLAYDGDSHRADYDAMMLIEVLKCIMEEFTLTIQDVIDITNKKVCFGKTKCWLNKHKGILWEDVVKDDEDYCRWILGSFEETDKTKDLLTYLEKVLG